MSSKKKKKQLKKTQAIRLFCTRTRFFLVWAVTFVSSFAERGIFLFLSISAPVRVESFRKLIECTAILLPSQQMIQRSIGGGDAVA
jgi:hypothetical protein